MRTMAAAAWDYLLVVVLSLGFAVTHTHSEEIEIYPASVGYLLVLRCSIARDPLNVTWSRGGRPNQSLPDGVEVKDGLLWFQPVQMSHNGSYICQRRDESGVRMTFGVLVSSEKCPDPPENISIVSGENRKLSCKQKEIFRLNKTRSVRWMKDCQPVVQEGRRFSVDEEGYMRLLAASEKDAGKYTCLVDVTLNGRMYTSARSMQLTIEEKITDEILPEPEMVEQDVVLVEVGTRAELQCKAYIGFSEYNDVIMYWTVNSSHVEDFKEFIESKKYTHDRGMVYWQSTLHISEVRPEFLNVPIRCHIVSPADKKVLLLRLQTADHSALHTIVALCLTSSLIILFLAAATFFFKVDLVLAYRDMLKRFSKQQAPDGKLYDAYVSFLPPYSSLVEAESFALNILPEQLEKHHGYSLFIRGRDDCPGEAVHDVIASTVRQCRRLIIILSTDARFSTNDTNETELLCDHQSQLCYEQRIGLHDALTQNDPKVILVEIGGPVDYSCLPESLRYLKRKQGSLNWNKPSKGAHKPTKFRSDRNFWKKLRYYMPAEAVGRPQTIV